MYLPNTIIIINKRYNKESFAQWHNSVRKQAMINQTKKQKNIVIAIYKQRIYYKVTRNLTTPNLKPETSNLKPKTRNFTTPNLTT